MSGFEIVGLVLGVLPLVIKGLESYEEGLKTLHAAWKYKNTISDLIITFETAAARYRDSCEVLLGPLLLASDEYASLIEEPGGEAWERKDIQDQLRARLGSACSTYIRLVHRLYKALLKFATKMALDPNNNMKPPWLKDGKTNIKTREQFLSSSNRLWRTTKMAFENGNLEKLLKEIENDLFRFERLIETSSRAAPVRQEARQKLTRRPWQSIQTAARSLFTAISTNWRCKCSTCHSSFLRLNAPFEQTSGQDEGSCTFALLVPNDSETTAHPNPMCWWQLDIESHGVSQKARWSPIDQSQTNPPHPRKQAITFLISAADDLHAGPALVSAPASYTQNIKISSLCDVLKQTPKPKHEVGYLEDQFWRHMIAVSQPLELPVQKSDLVSIADILGHKPQSNASQISVPKLNIREKYRIALLLTSAVLQLFQTPWLVDSSMLDKVYLVSPSAGSRSRSHPSSVTPSPTIKDLYISDQPTTAPPNAQKRFWIPNETLFTLAILLLELSYLAPLASFKTAGDLDHAGCDTPLTEHSIAARLADDIVSREPSRYSDAIRRCLYCQFDTSSRDFSESSLQEEFWHCVVEPLRELDAVFA